MNAAPDRTLRTALALQAGRLAGRASLLTGRGAGVTIGGKVALTLAPRLLAELAAGRQACVVSGTNGKTTTTRLIASVLTAAGQVVVSNETGANLASGLASALSDGDPRARPVLEIDEAVLPRVVEAVDPSLVVLTNLSRDQLDRYGEVGTVANRWRAMLAERPGQPVVANSRDPLVVWSANQSATTWVDTGFAWVEDSTACPACGELLDWSGDRFRCTCGFAQPEADAVLEGNTLRLGEERVELSLSLPGRWNLANAAIALVAAHRLGVGLAKGAEAIARVQEVGGRQATWTLPGTGRSARLLLAKNPAGWTEVLRDLSATGSGAVLALNARIADGKDPSWLWDVPFELLAGRPPGTVAASGERYLDMAVRLRYAEVACLEEPDPLRAAAEVQADQVDVVATYTAFVGILRRLKSPTR